MSFYAGAGGTDAQDWAEMLLKMYLRYAEFKEWPVNVIERTKGAEAGIKNATIEIQGKDVYGYLKKEKGVHRLIRLSPFNSNNLRQTSFALVEVLPLLKDDNDFKIKASDLRVDTFHASGAGGQHVNTTDSAVRITHLPTGLVATCQNERSQSRNKSRAMEILRSRLAQKMEEQKVKRIVELKGESKKIEWSSQIRSYVLHPYKQVKDHRTGYQTTQVEDILNGQLDEVVEANLKIKKADK